MKDAFHFIHVNILILVKRLRTELTDFRGSSDITNGGGVGQFTPHGDLKPTAICIHRHRYYYNVIHQCQ